MSIYKEIQDHFNYWHLFSHHRKDFRWKMELPEEVLRAIDRALEREKEIFRRELHELLRPLEERIERMNEQLLFTSVAPAG